MKLTQDLDPEHLAAVKRAFLQSDPRVAAGTRSLELYTTDTGCRILHAVEETEHGTLRHVSISHPERYPTWDEIRDTKYALFQDGEDAVMILPRKKGGPRYVNVHPRCFHLWELPEIPGPSGKWELE